MNPVRVELLGFAKLPNPIPGDPDKWFRNVRTGMIVGVGLSEGRWHLSASFHNRTPSWDEMKEVRDAFLDEDRFFMFPMPPQKYYLNAHPHCLHLWEVIDYDTKEFLKAEGS